MELSIITINYNNREGLQKTIDSILAQTWREFEWIIIDGGSTDGSKELIEKTAAECPNVSYWCSEPDKGVYNAQNKGIIHASGEYMNFMNSGDTFFDKNTLRNVWSEKHDKDVIYGDWLTCRNSEEVLAQNTKEVTIAWFWWTNICHQAMFIKGDLLKASPYDEKYRVFADWAKWMQFSWEGKSFEYVPYIICRFELGGMSGSSLPIKDEEIKKIKQILPLSVQKAFSALDGKMKLLDRYEYFRFNREALQLMETRPLFRRLFKICTICVRNINCILNFFHL